MTAECHKFQCSKIQNGGHPTAIYYDRLLSEMKYDFVESSYAVADLDYNETYITKTQNFKIRYSERRPQWKKIYFPAIPHNGLSDLRSILSKTQYLTKV